MSQDKIEIQKRCKVNMKKTIVAVDIKPDICVLEKDVYKRQGHDGCEIRFQK